MRLGVARAAGVVPARLLGRLLVAALALVLGYVAVVVGALAVDVGDLTVDGFTGYQGVVAFLRDRPEPVWGAVTRAGMVAGGLVLGTLALLAAVALIPRPAVNQGRLTLEDEAGGTPGTTVVSARAIERLARIAAEQVDGIASARAQCRDGASLTVLLDLPPRPDDRITAVLERVRDDVRRALEQHGLPARRVDAILAGAPIPPKREVI